MHMIVRESLTRRQQLVTDDDDDDDDADVDLEVLVISDNSCHRAKRHVVMTRYNRPSVRPWPSRLSVKDCFRK